MSKLADELLGQIDELRAERPGPDVAGRLAAWLVEQAGPARRADLADIVGATARQLAPSSAPEAFPERSVWDALVVAADRLYGSGVHRVGGLDRFGARLVERLAGEARASAPPGGRDRNTAPAGPVLAELAASAVLRGVLSATVGFELAATDAAVFLHEAPGTHVRMHLDARGYEVVFHLVLEHEVPAGRPGSALVVYVARQAKPVRMQLGPGDAVALRGRGTIHGWEPLGESERRTLIAIGFRAARRGRATSGQQ